VLGSNIANVLLTIDVAAVIEPATNGNTAIRRNAVVMLTLSLMLVGNLLTDGVNPIVGSGHACDAGDLSRRHLRTRAPEKILLHR
jgi:Ca2+/Na+ antiporter